MDVQIFMANWFVSDGCNPPDLQAANKVVNLQKKSAGCFGICFEIDTFTGVIGEEGIDDIKDAKELFEVGIDDIKDEKDEEPSP